MLTKIGMVRKQYLAVRSCFRVVDCCRAAAAADMFTATHSSYCPQKLKCPWSIPDPGLPKESRSKDIIHVTYTIMSGSIWQSKSFWEKCFTYTAKIIVIQNHGNFYVQSQWTPIFARSIYKIIYQKLQWVRNLDSAHSKSHLKLNFFMTFNVHVSSILYNSKCNFSIHSKLSIPVGRGDDAWVSREIPNWQDIEGIWINRNLH